MENKRGQQTMGMPFGMIFDVAREVGLADQNCFAILATVLCGHDSGEPKSFGNKFRNSQFNSTCSVGGIL